MELKKEVMCFAQDNTNHLSIFTSILTSTLTSILTSTLTSMFYFPINSRIVNPR